MVVSLPLNTIISKEERTGKKVCVYKPLQHKMNINFVSQVF